LNLLQINTCQCDLNPYNAHPQTRGATQVSQWMRTEEVGVFRNVLTLFENIK